jgi:hypothetical protein
MTARVAIAADNDIKEVNLALNGRALRPSWNRLSITRRRSLWLRGSRRSRFVPVWRRIVPTNPEARRRFVALAIVPTALRSDVWDRKSPSVLTRGRCDGRSPAR